MWSAIQYVTSVFTLLAFITAVAGWVVRSASNRKTDLIGKLPAKDRLAAALAVTDAVRIDTSRLDEGQIFEIAQSQLRQRADQARRVTNWSGAVVICLLVAVVVVAFLKPKDAPAGPVVVSPASPANDHCNGPRLLIAATALREDTHWNHPDRIVEIQGAFLTQGHSLEITACQLIADDASIAAFAPNATESKAESGKDGAAATVAGAAGDVGGSGKSGKRGTTPSTIALAADTFSGHLLVDNSGEAGGDGGKGGNGGSGGQGVQGSPSEPGVSIGTIGDCRSGPGQGGPGGAGGNGAPGASGGDGGKAGAIVVAFKHNFVGSLQLINSGGKGGLAGANGQGGPGGSGGPEGALRGSCTSSGRVGPAGPMGSGPNTPIPPATDGSDGAIHVVLPNVETDATGKYSYSSN